MCIVDVSRCQTRIVMLGTWKGGGGPIITWSTNEKQTTGTEHVTSVTDGLGLDG